MPYTATCSKDVSVYNYEDNRCNLNETAVG